MTKPVATVRRSVHSIEATDLAMTCYASRILQIGYPNTLKPDSDRRPVAKIGAKAVRGRVHRSDQRFEITSTVVFERPFPAIGEITARRRAAGCVRYVFPDFERPDRTAGTYYSLPMSKVQAAVVSG